MRVGYLELPIKLQKIGFEIIKNEDCVAVAKKGKIEVSSGISKSGKLLVVVKIEGRKKKFVISEERGNNANTEELSNATKLINKLLKQEAK